MSGIRIHELSKELLVPSKKLIEIAMSMGYPVKSHSSSIDDMLADRLRRQALAQGLAEKKPAKAKPKAKTAKTKTTAKAKKIDTKPKPVEKKPEKEVAPEPEKAVVPVEEKEIKKQEEPAKVVPATVKETKKPAPSPVVAKESAKSLEESALRKERERRKAAESALSRIRAEDRLRREDDKKRKLEEAELAKKEAEAEKALSAKQRAEKRATEADRLKQKEAAEQFRKDEEKKRKESRKKRREDDVRRKKEQEEERELARLIKEEEANKRAVERLNIVIDEATTVKEFAEKLDVGVNEIIMKLMGRGVMANLNQTIDIDIAKEMALEMGYNLMTSEEREEKDDTPESEEEEVNLISRPPVVTIMGHVDHGKTSLLDTIRSARTNIADAEAGGITQSIGAYRVELDSGSVVFLDTPGHEAFTTMRARGAAVTDVVVLVVAADDGVMPQTVEAIHHATAANVPVIVAVNKIDKPDASPDKVKQELSQHGLQPEDWGGNAIFCHVSAKTGEGIKNLLEMLVLQSEMLELRANPERSAFGTIIESRLDKGRGAVATVLVQKGTLKIGDAFVAGSFAGKVKALIDDAGSRVSSAGPSVPVEILGFSSVPNAGDTFTVVESERKANQIAIARQKKERLEGLTSSSRGHVKLENIHAQITKGEIKDLNIIVKADVQGSIEAVSKALEDIKMDEVRIRTLHGAVGAITEADVSLASASDAIIIGFNVRPTDKARDLAEKESVDIKLYNVIYNAIDDVKAALEGMLEPVMKEIVTGKAEVRKTFKITKVGTIAGCMVVSGKVVRNIQARLLRDNVVIHEGKLSSLKRFKDDAKDVASGYECGIGLEAFNDVKLGDEIETFTFEEIERKST